MDSKEFFSNALSYGHSAEYWIKTYFNSVGYVMRYTFANDFAVADWMEGLKGIDETYERIKKEWLDDYKAFTEAVMCINMLAWFNNQLINQGVTRVDFPCEEIGRKYSDLYYQAREDFYNRYEDNQEACDYFFKTTD